MTLNALTGGPGSGKTTVIAALREEGFECVPDVARAIIQETNSAGPQLPPPAPASSRNRY